MNNPIVEKLRKLIAHERSARSIGNLPEAEAFAAKIQAILTAHKLSMSEVDFQAREEGEPINWEHVDGNEVGRGGRRVRVYWRQQIAITVAKINSCMIVNETKSRGNAFFFVGRTSDRELAKILYLYLVELGEDLCASAARKNRAEQMTYFNTRNGISANNTPSWAMPAFNRWMKEYRDSWKTGFGQAIAERLQKQYDDTIKQQEAADTTALVHIRQDELAVRKYLAGKTVKSRGRGTSGSMANGDGYAEGKSTGHAVNLSPHRFAGASGRASRLLGA